MIRADPESLAAVLAAAAPGAEVELVDGAYGAVRLTRPVRLFGTAAAVLAGLTIAGAKASATRVEGLAVRLAPRPETTQKTPVVLVSGAADVALVGLTVRGGRAVDGAQAGRLIGRGVNLVNADRVAVSRCDLAECDDGIVISRGADVAILDNDIHDTRGSPINGAAGVGLTIAQNHLRDVTPWNWGDADGTEGDHANFIHLWPTAAGAPVERLRILDNLLDQGAGVPILGLHLDDRGLGAGFRDVAIERNVILLGNHQGMRLENVTGHARGNRLLQVSGDAKAAPTTVLAYGSKVAFTDNEMADPRGLLGLDPTNGIVPPGVQRGARIAGAREGWLMDHRPDAPDPRDTRIADLAAQLEAAQASVASLLDINGQIAAQRDTLQAQVTDALDRLGRVRAALA